MQQSRRALKEKYVGDKTFILDVAHNPAAVKTLVDTLEESPMSTVAIFSALIDKDIIDMVNLASRIYPALVPGSLYPQRERSNLMTLRVSSQTPAQQPFVRI